MKEIILNIVFTVLGFLLSVIWETSREKRSFRRELEENNKIDLTGCDWFAAWQTSVNGQENINTESINIEQKGGVVKMRNVSKAPENPKGGYMWEGKLQFYQGRDLMGHYFALKREQSTNKGIMYFSYQSARKEFVGRWVGNSYDGPLLSGFVVISKSREGSVNRLKELLKTHPDKVQIISYAS